MTAPDPIAEERPEDERPLAGRCIALLEHRELDRLGRMLEEQGAETLRCPLVAIVDAPDPAPVEAWLRRAIAAPFDDLVLMTGEGLRRLRGIAERAGIEPGFRDALGRMRTITRGPKPARALREIGLNPGVRAETPTTEGVIAALATGELAGRRVGVQLPPDAPPRLGDFLREAGAWPDPVMPYAYVPRADRGEIVAMIEEMTAGRVDAIAFTSAPQVRRLTAVAEKTGRTAALSDGLARIVVAAIGPVVSAELERLGVKPSVAPPGETYFMKPLVRALADAFAARAPPA
jgi:uroporphyrinogen-III synthase